MLIDISMSGKMEQINQFIFSQVTEGQGSDCEIISMNKENVRGSIVVSIPTCHAGNRDSIPRRGVTLFFQVCLFFLKVFLKSLLHSMAN